MYENLVNFVCAASAEDVAALEVQEIAIVSAWYEGQKDAGLPMKPYAAVPDQIQTWIRDHSSIQNETEGRRLQPLLRLVLDRAVEKGPEALHRNELDLLVHAHALIGKCADKQKFERLSRYFMRQTESISAARGQMSPAPGMKGIAPFLRIVVPSDIRQAPARSVSNFAGVKLPGRGPVFRHKGDLKVIGEVPDDTMVVVEDGSCLVHGYVFGRVAVTQDCEVRDNIAGVVVSSLGDIRARNVLTGAFVVSKWAQVVVRKTESPQLLFAGRRILIREDAQDGRYASPEILIDGIARSGEFSVCRSVSAGSFEQAETRKLYLILRRSITPEDYGGLVDPVANRLLSTLRRKRQRRDSWKANIKLAESEMKQFARNALHFLTGGDTLLEGLKEIDRQERQLSLCVRILGALDTLTMNIEDQIAASIADSDANAGETVRDAALLIRDLRQELSEIQRSDSDEGELSSEIVEIDEIIQELGSVEKQKSLPSTFLFDLQERRDVWEERRGELLISLEKKMSAVDALLGANDLRKKNEQLSELTVLARVLNAAKKRPANDLLFKRTQSNFVMVMLRSIDVRKERIRHYQEMVDEAEAELEEVGRRLESEAHVPVPPERLETDEPPIAEGVFGPGITICTDRYVINDVRAPETSRFVTDGMSTKPMVFTRKHNRIGVERLDAEH